MRVFKSDSFAHAYSQVVRKLITEPDFTVSPRDQKTYEIQNAAIVITNPYSNLFNNLTRSINKKYLAGELLWYFSGRDDVAFISKYSKFWNKVANEDGTCNSAYGKRIFREVNKHGISEWKWAYDSLSNDKNTRQAIIRFNKPEFSYVGNKDFICSLVANFQIRNDKLYFTTHMRSQDIFFGAPFDLPFFMLLMQIMKVQLKDKYPDLELGTYTHIVDSLHLYERNLDLLQESLKYAYMEEELPRITQGFLPINNEGIPNWTIARIINGTYDDGDKLNAFSEWLIDNSKLEHELETNTTNG